MILAQFSLVVAFTAVAMSGDGIAPVTLLQLTREADLIVVADVTKVVHNGRGKAAKAVQAGADPNANDLVKNLKLGQTIAILRVNQVLKGDAKAQDVIHVTYHAGLICPRPPRYVLAEKILAFLKKNGDGWVTLGLGYGTRVIDAPGDSEAYRVRIRELVEIWKRDDPQIRNAEVVDWAVRCIEHPMTRWDGAYQLDRALNFNGSRRSRPLEIQDGDLSSPQRSRIISALMSMEKDNSDSSVMRRVVSAMYDGGRTRRRIENLKNLRLLDEAVAKMARSNMLEISESLGWPEGKEIATRLVLGENTPKAHGRKRFQIVRDFRRQAIKREKLCTRRVKHGR